MYIYAYNESDLISILKIINICYLIHFNGYYIILFALIGRVTNIQNFQFRLKRMINRINIYVYFVHP